MSMTEQLCRMRTHSVITLVEICDTRKKESSEESPYENTLTLIQAHDVMPIEIAHRHCLLDKAPNITQVKSTHVLDKCKF